jgi:hypothetical protein
MTTEIDPVIARDVQRLVPSFDGRKGNWDRVLGRAQPALGSAYRFRSLRSAALVPLAAVIALAVVLATPAFGLQKLVVDFFSGAQAPAPVVKSFDSLATGAPAGMDPQVTAGEAREAASYTLAGGATVKLWVAPTSAGGFCFEYSGFGSGCDRNHSLTLAPGLMATSLADGPAVVAGDVLLKQASEIRISFAAGTTTTEPVTWISKPIDAGFFFYEVPKDQWTEASRPTEVSALDDSGAVLASHQLANPFAAVRAAQGN